MVRFFSCSTCVIHVPIHWHLSQYCLPRLFMFSLSPKPRVAYVVIIGPLDHSNCTEKYDRRNASSVSIKGECEIIRNEPLFFWIPERDMSTWFVGPTVCSCAFILPILVGFRQVTLRLIGLCATKLLVQLCGFTPIYRFPSHYCWCV